MHAIPCNEAGTLVPSLSKPSAAGLLPRLFGGFLLARLRFPGNPLPLKASNDLSGRNACNPALQSPPLWPVWPWLGVRPSSPYPSRSPPGLTNTQNRMALSTASSIRRASEGFYPGFYPVFTDTYKKADSGHEECSCQSVGSSVPSSSVVRLSSCASTAFGRASQCVLRLQTRDVALRVRILRHLATT